MMRAAPDGCFYADSKAFEARLRSWLDGPDWASIPLLNSLQSVVEQKYLAIGLMVRQLRSEFGLRSQMSGSGSSCFVLLDGSDQAPEIEQFIRRNWGPAAWIQHTSIKEKCSDDLSC